MRLRTALRSTGALWFLPALFAVASIIGADALTVVSGYATSDLASAGVAFCFAGPLLAGFVAFQLRGFPKFSRTLRGGRRGLLALTHVFWPLLLGGPVVATAAVLIAAGTLPHDLPGTGLVVLGAATVAACAGLGLGLSRALPVVLAAPLAVASTYAWLLVTPGLDRPLLHNMNGWFPSCCAPDAVPARGALLAGFTVALLVWLGTAGALLPNRWASLPRSAALAVVIATLAAALGAGVAVVRLTIAKPTLQAVDPRTTALVCRTEHAVELCVWPENTSRSAAVLSEVTRLNKALGRWELARVQRLGERPTVERGAVEVSAGPGSTADLRYSLAAGYVDQSFGCLGAFGRARDERVALLGMALGLRPDELDAYLSPGAVEVAEARYNEAKDRSDEIRGWFEGGTNAICGPAR